MKSNIQAILNRKHFFNIISSNSKQIIYKLEKPSQILIKNIYINWLRYLLGKTHKTMPVFIENSHNKFETTKPPYGYLKNIQINYRNTVLNHNIDEFSPEKKTEIDFSIILPKEDVNQYFIQWQRYRKYWWSSITTTPSLFAVDDVKQTENESNVDIIAKLPCGIQPVERITVQNDKSLHQCTKLNCKMNLEDALITLLLDGTTNSEDEYLRLHRKLAPYKISFALKIKDDNKETLKDLAKLLYYRLKLEKISAWLPDFTMSLEDQIKENLHMGVTYTAILSDSTLNDGIFHLKSSSTTLEEQVHVADFHSYAALICSSK